MRAAFPAQFDPMSRARFSTLIRDVINWSVDAYRFRGYLPAEERALTLHRRVGLLRWLADIAGTSLTSVSDSSVSGLNASSLRADELYIVASGDGTDDTYAVDLDVPTAEAEEIEKQTVKIIQAGS